MICSGNRKPKVEVQKSSSNHNMRILSVSHFRFLIVQYSDSTTVVSRPTVSGEVVVIGDFIEGYADGDVRLTESYTNP